MWLYYQHIISDLQESKGAYPLGPPMTHDHTWYTQCCLGRCGYSVHWIEYSAPFHGIWSHFLSCKSYNEWLSIQKIR